MKALLIVFLLTATAWAVERGEVERLVKRAADAEVPQWDSPERYLEARALLERMGEAALPVLREMAEDPKLTWQERLVARIVVERIERGEEIRALQFHNWGQYPESRGEPDEWKRERVPEANRVSRMGPVVVGKMKDVGAWYYFVEQNWKTMQVRRESAHAWFSSSGHPWPRWCRAALDGQPEEIFLWWAIAERLDEREDPVQAYADSLLYGELFKRRITRAVPVLLKPRGMRKEHLAHIMEFAAPEHAELIERYIAEHEESLGNLRPILEELRRRAPLKIGEPPFRSEKRPPLEGTVKPPPGFFDPPKPPPPPPPSQNTPEDVIIEVN